MLARKRASKQSYLQFLAATTAARRRDGGLQGVRMGRAQARRVRQQEEVREVAELLGVDESCAMLLLRSAAWNKEALLSNYMDDADKVGTACTHVWGSGSTKGEQTKAAHATGEKDSREVCQARYLSYAGNRLTANDGYARQVCAAAGVPGPSTSLSAVKRSQLRKDFECRICRSDGELSVSSLACGHDFCDTCWEQFLTLKTDGGDVHICCPEPSCSLQVRTRLVCGRLCR
jgi:ariadne-1